MLAVATVFAFAAALAPAAQAGYFKMVACAGNNGVPGYTTETNTIIFEFHNFCTGGGGDPPGDAAYLRINDNQSSGTAVEGVYGQMVWDTPNWVHWKAAGGYTREPYVFNQGWRARFWMVDFNNNGVQLLTQGAGLPNSGTQWDTTPTFGPHLWPWNYYLDFHRFVFQLECVRPAGCERAGYNAADANGFVFILSDDSPSQVGFTNTGSALMQAEWVRGSQTVTWNSSDLGSGLRFERLRADGADRYVLDYQAAGACNTSSSQLNSEWARSFQPCPTGGPFGRAFALDTSTLSDGAHNLTVCSQDFGQYQGLDGTGGETCDTRMIRTDNTPPGAPSGLEVTSANPQRYLDHFDAGFSLPPNEGSPIAKVHYDVVNAAGEVVVSEKTLVGTNPTELKEVEGPAKPGEYRLRVWLEDGVGLLGPAATAPIPHDTTPPAAPQEVAVTSPGESRQADGFDVRWRNIVDAGSPIDTVHYQVLNQSGAITIPTQTVSGDNVETIPNLENPEDRGAYTLKMWLSDAEGNVGAPSSVPLSYDCVRAAATNGAALASGLGENGSPSEVVQEGLGTLLRGSLRAADGSGVANATLCVFSRVVTDQGREFLGLAVTGSDGGYSFPIPAGASRDLSVIYRRDHRELVSHATIETVVHPILRVKSNVVYNKHLAYFFGAIPGPHNDRVVVVLQAKVGKGWTTFRRYRTRDNGQFSLTYRFRRTFRRTRYVMRAQVRQTIGYPYLEGNSDLLGLLVLPRARHG